MAWLAPSPPVLNPRLPYRGAIPGGAKDGKCIQIAGQINHAPNHFVVNLCCGSHYGSDIALHFNPRFTDNSVVRNTQANGQWGPEEKHGAFPFIRGQAFDMTIRMKNDAFKIMLNGQPFCDFHHRMPMFRVDTLHIDGDITVSSIVFEEGMHTGGVHVHVSQQGYNQPPAGGGGGAFALQQFNPPVPFSARIPGAMFPGRMVFVTATPAPYCDRFSIDLSTAYGDIAFHFNPRFGEKQVVRNSMISNQWGQEERNANQFPFMHNARFDVIILCEAHQFKVAVNGQHFVEFRHRNNALNQIDFVKVDGQVVLHEIKVQ